MHANNCTQLVSDRVLELSATSYKKSCCSANSIKFVGIISSAAHAAAPAYSTDRSRTRLGVFGTRIDLSYCCSVQLNQQRTKRASCDFAKPCAVKKLRAAVPGATATVGLLERCENHQHHIRLTLSKSCPQWRTSKTNIHMFIRLIHCVSKKVPSFKLSVTLSNLNRFPKFYHYYITHLTLGTLLHYLGISEIQMFCKYLADMEKFKNANKLHFQCIDFNSRTCVTVYAACIYVFLSKSCPRR